MDKRKLEIDGLRVESFSAGGAAGVTEIVGAQASGHPDCTSVYLCTLQTCGLPACPA